MTAVREGQLDEEVLDKNVEQILWTMLQSPRHRGYKYSNKPDLRAHALVARQAAAEGMVLLKDERGTLPSATGMKTIAAFGNTSYEIVTGGSGSGKVNEAQARQPARTGPGAMFMGRPPIYEMAVGADLAARMADETGIALVILNIGGVIETASWRDLADAILLIGQETGNSIVDVLSGKADPSRRLAGTFPMSYADVPSAKDFACGGPVTRSCASSANAGSASSFKARTEAKPAPENSRLTLNTQEG